MNEEAMSEHVTIEEAAWRVLAAIEHKRDTINGQGHPGEPHDRVLAHPYSSVLGPEVAVYETVGDCAKCGGAQYGADDLENAAWGDLREALGLRRYQWQPDYPGEAFAPYREKLRESQP